MSDVPRITEAEWEVMNVVWSSPPKSALEVADALADSSWNIKTIKTLLTRLVKKRALRFEVDGQRYLYHPTVSREACVREEGRSLLRRIKDAPVSPLVAHFLRESPLSSRDIAELRRLLDEKEQASSKGER